MLYSVPFWFPNSTYSLVNTDFYAGTDASNNMKQHFTILFNTFVMMNLFYQVSCRKLGWNEMNVLEHFTNNSWFIIILGGEFAIQWLIIEFPLFQIIFRTVSLEWSMHITCWIFGLGAIGVNLAAKKVFDDEDAYAPYFNIKMNEDLSQETNKVLKKMQSIKRRMDRKDDEFHSCCKEAEERLIHQNEQDGCEDEENHGHFD